MGSGARCSHVDGKTSETDQKEEESDLDVEDDVKWMWQIATVKDAGGIGKAATAEEDAVQTEVAVVEEAALDQGSIARCSPTERLSPLNTEDQIKKGEEEIREQGEEPEPTGEQGAGKRRKLKLSTSDQSPEGNSEPDTSESTPGAPLPMTAEEEWNMWMGWMAAYGENETVAQMKRVLTARTKSEEDLVHEECRSAWRESFRKIREDEETKARIESEKPFRAEEAAAREDVVMEAVTAVEEAAPRQSSTRDASMQTSPPGEQSQEDNKNHEASGPTRSAGSKGSPAFARPEEDRCDL
ncbi:hypothetical protein JCM11491_001633 [Sporobolomyces phaffii]